MLLLLTVNAIGADMENRGHKACVQAARQQQSPPPPQSAERQ